MDVDVVLRLSRFIGVFYLGFSLGPVVGAYFIRNPLPMFSSSSSSSSSAIHTHTDNVKGMIQTFASRAIPGRSGVPNVTSVFWVAVLCSFVNLVFAIAILPESLDKVRRRAAMKAREAEEAERRAEEEALLREQDEIEEEVEVSGLDLGREEEGAPKSVSVSVSKSRSKSQGKGQSKGKGKGKGKGKSRSVEAIMRRTSALSSGTVKRLFGPLAVFAPKKVYRTSASGRVSGARTDWSLTMLAGSLAFYLLSSVSVPFPRYMRRG